MKKILFLLLVISSISTVVLSQNVKAYLGYNEFYSPKDGQYLQAYVNIQGESLTWNKEKSKYSSRVELTVVFKSDTTVVAFSKDIIISEVNDSSEMNQIFMHTNNYLLENGNYNIDIKIDDLNDTSKAIFSTSEFIINNPIDSVYSSSIEVFSKIEKTNDIGLNVKGGYRLTPFIYRYFGEQDSVLQFYSEIYNTENKWGKDDAFLITYYLVNNATIKEVPKYRKYKRLNTTPVAVVMGSFDISKLESGNYSMVLEIVDRNNNLISSKNYFFRRNNPNVSIEIDDVEDINIAETFVELIKGKDTLSSIIRTFRPISSVQEQSLSEEVIRNGNEYVMQQYIYSFWENRNINDPFDPFKKYMDRIKDCDKLYSTRIKRGYETSRGRIFMLYGKANSIAAEYNDPAAYPYEIWHYYQARGQRNLKFVFYNTDLASNEFELLHSNAAGERSDYQWRLRLRRDQSFRSIDDSGSSQDDWGSQYNNLYENPR
ncbi:MAG: GWxTD domain-containing protein [Bacteroidales bacterium]|nr:GWxTD domain-containing protein [Bacteroidales bacterium]